MSLETANAARGRWPGILQALGVDSKFLKDVHGPCPICGGKDRFRFDDKLSGAWFCNQCTKKGERPDGFSLLEKLNGWDFKRAASEVDKIVGRIPETETKPEQSAEKKADYMKRLFKESRIVTPGDPVWLYLTRRCGDPSEVLADLRYHPALHHSVDGGNHPAMLAFMGWNPGKGKFSGIHRTYLTRDGQKAQVDPVRMTYGDVGAIRLGPILERMGVAEGIETAICAGKMFGLPVWATHSANGMKAWTPPEGVQRVVVFADNDGNDTGLGAAFALAARLFKAGIEYEIRMPQQAGTDWADSFAEQQVAA